MKIIKYVFVFSIVCVLISCQRTDSELEHRIVGDWQLVNFSTNQIIGNRDEFHKAARQLIMTTALIIRKDGTIKSIIWGTSQRGYWKLSGKELIVYDQRRGEKFKAQIIKLTDDQLLLYQRIGKVKVVLYFKRFD